MTWSGVEVRRVWLPFLNVVEAKNELAKQVQAS